MSDEVTPGIRAACVAIQRLTFKEMMLLAEELANFFNEPQINRDIEPGLIAEALDSVSEGADEEPPQ